MDDSPRSAKRRKIETPNRNASSPLATGSAKRSGRLAARAARAATLAVTNATEDEDESAVLEREASEPITSPPTRTSNRTARKRAVQDDKDIYDDFEGAFSPARQTGGTRKKRRQMEVEQLAAVSKPTSTLRRLHARANGVTADHGTADAMEIDEVNGHDEEPGNQEDIEVEVATPTRRKATKTIKSVRNTSIRKDMKNPPTSARRTTRRTVEVDEDKEPDTLQKEQTTTSARRTRKARTPTSKNEAETRNGMEENDEEDELAPVTPSKSSRARRAAPKDTGDVEHRGTSKIMPGTRTRRATNRADNVHSMEEITAAPDTEDDDLLIRINGSEVDLLDNDAGSVGGSILDPSEPSPFNPIRKEADPLPVLHGELVPGRELDLLKNIVMERITGRRPVPLSGLDNEYKIVHQLVEHTVTAGEGNSLLLIGARGSGKTTLVNKILSDVAKDNPEDFHIARLNGFIHTDDKIALREIWRQLGKEMDIEEDGIGKNYADTLTTLLALLSHPSEQTGEETDQVTKAVIFVMDEFDLFASHPRQTLLYNLFDIAQSRKAPIAVLGLTTRIDVADSLEEASQESFQPSLCPSLLSEILHRIPGGLQGILDYAGRSAKHRGTCALKRDPQNNTKKEAEEGISTAVRAFGVER